MVQGIVTKSGNSYALRVPKSYVVNNHLKLGDKVSIEEPLARQEQALKGLINQAKKYGPIKNIEDPVAWQRLQRVSTDPWSEARHDSA